MYERPYRRTHRLAGYNYRSAAAYFVTIVTADRIHLFGEVIAGGVQLNQLGTVAHHEWLQSAGVRPDVRLDTFVIMPNHVHGIVRIDGPEGRGWQQPAQTGDAPLDRTGRPLVSRSLGALVRGYKAAVTRQVNDLRGTPGGRVWQRNYYEHIVRNDESLDLIRHYIRLNPERWQFDPENEAAGPDAWEKSFWRQLDPQPGTAG